MSLLSAFFDAILRPIVLPKGTVKGAATGAGTKVPSSSSVTDTFNPSNDKVTIPTFNDHLADIYDDRLSVSDYRDMVKKMMVFDTDFSATKDAYLTLSETEPVFSVYNPAGEIDEAGHQQLESILDCLFVPSDYSIGFRPVQTFRSVSERMRYMFLMRGCVIAELVLDKQKLPYAIVLADPKTIEWHELAPGQLSMIQIAPLGGARIPLISPTIFAHFFHQDPTEVYPRPHFTSAINTVAARQAVINTLYQIMRTTGAARLEVEIVEEVVRKNIPAEIASDPNKVKSYFNDIMNSIATQISTLRPEQAFVHFDSVKPQFIDQKGTPAGMEAQISDVITTLDNQNQAGLKTMGTVIGRGESGVNTSSVEARVFAMNTDGLNRPVGEVWGQILTLAMRLLGYQGKVEVCFKPVEMRPSMELEPQRLIMQQRLLQDLSLGLITDIEYHLQMYNRLPPAGVPELSGTGFMAVDQTMSVSPSPNSDPLGRSVSGGAAGSKAAKSNSVKKPVKAALALIASEE